MYKRGQFKINGRHSREFNVYMQHRPAKTAAARVIELRQRVGNDSIVIDNAYHKNVTLTIDCYFKASSIDQVQFYEDLVSEWLDMGDYSDFVTYYDEQYIYQAIVTEPPQFKGTRKTGPMVPFSFQVSIRPFKYNRVGRQVYEYDKQFHINNFEKYPSKPRFKLFGSGDASFFVNNQEFKIRGLDRELIIDSLIEESYRDLGGVLEHQDKKTLFRDFPELQSGDNEIRWTKNIEKIELIPRWCRKV